MPSRPSVDEAHARAVTRLADDPRTDTATLEASVSDEVIAHRRIARALGDAGPASGPELRASVARRIGERYGDGPARGRTGRRSSWGLRPTIGAGALVAACIAAAVLLVTGGFSGSGVSPTVAAAARLAQRPATGPAPAAQGRFVDARYAGVRFPSYAAQRVPTLGVRSDRIGGRPTYTVVYRLPDGAPMSYTVFSGRPVPVPAGASTTRAAGVTLRSFRAAHGITVVTLVRFGRTCVLAGPATRRQLLGLAIAPVRDAGA